MKRTSCIKVALALFLSATALQAQELDDAKRLWCEFPTIVSVPVAPGIVAPKIAPQTFTLVFDDIDREQATAALVGNLGSEAVVVIPGSESLTFIEVTPIGYVNVTTAYRGPPVGPGIYRAVTSRHTGTISQAYGTCAVR